MTPLAIKEQAMALRDPRDPRRTSQPHLPSSKTFEDSILSPIKPPKPKKSSALWRGPEEDGVTFSLLSRFLVCRERFRLLVCEGLKPVDSFNHRLGYGDMWHVCEEALAANLRWEAALETHVKRLFRAYPMQAEQIDHWYNVCKVQFPIYIDYWSKHPDVLNRTPLMQEQEFCVRYRLPSGRSVKLRGKWDSVDLIGDAPSCGVYLQENKTKGDIREVQLVRQLTFDLQTMIYLVALQEEQRRLDDSTIKNRLSYRDPSDPKHRYFYPILGVRYNVVRRPLSGGKGSIVQHKPSKSNPSGESKEHFYARLQNDYIKAEPQTYFMRWKVEVSEGDVAAFRKQTLDPILEQLIDWYQWVTTSTDPFTPGHQMTGTYHWRHPFGVYNPLDEGGSSDVDEFLTSGSEVGLTRVDNLFPELKTSMHQ
jgi:hypothetical protein